MAEKLVGKWKFETTEGFDEYMKALEVNFALRKIGAMTEPREEIRIENDEWFLDILSTFKNVHLKFKLAEEFEEKTVDGRLMKSTFTTEDGKLVHNQTGKPVDCRTTRELVDDDTMRITLVPIGREGTCIRTFSRIK